MIRILQGDCLEVLKTLPDESVHCVVTSPPYWGLRDYGVDGQLGLEPSPQEYVAAMVEVFASVKRVLRDDGTLWLNLGDSYAGSNMTGGTNSKEHGRRADRMIPNRNTGFVPDGLKQKDIVGIPWRVAFALQADGWWLRQDIIWAKPNPMPESVTDRCTKAHEYIFLLAKSERYFYDAAAIAEPSITGDPRKPYAPGQVDARGDGHDRNGGAVRESVKRGGFNGKTNALEGREAFRAIQDTRNKRSVWTVTTKAYSDAHFATFPPDLIEPCILAGCPKDGTVLDPFGGAGTTGLVADRLDRDAILIELNPEYAEMARKRIKGDCPMFADVS